MPVNNMAEPRARTLLKSIYELLFHAVHEDILLRPSRLVKMLQKHPRMRVHISDADATIAEHRVVRWHEWGDFSALAKPHGTKGAVAGWKAVDGSYVNFKTTIPALMAFAKCHSIVEWSCEIQDLCGFSRSESDLSQFSSLDLLAQREARDLIMDQSEAGLTRNLAHPGVRILNSPKTTDHFVRFAWDKRTFLDATHGSHHLAAARFIAKRLGKSVTLPGLLRTYAVSQEAVNLMNADYDMFAISNDAIVKQALHEAMRSFKATYLLHRLPSPVDDAVAVLLPRNERRSVMVSSVLRRARMFDIGAHLTTVCAKQAFLM